MRMATQPPAGGSATWGDLIAQRARGVADSVARTIAYPAITPNLLTVVGFLLTCGVALLIADGWELLGGVLVIAVGLFDMLDGAPGRPERRAGRVVGQPRDHAGRDRDDRLVAQPARERDDALGVGPARR